MYLFPARSLQYGHTECTPVMSFLCSALEKRPHGQFPTPTICVEFSEGKCPLLRASWDPSCTGETLIDTYAELYSEVNPVIFMHQTVWQDKTSTVLKGWNGWHIFKKELQGPDYIINLISTPFEFNTGPIFSFWTASENIPWGGDSIFVFIYFI